MTQKKPSNPLKIRGVIHPTLNFHKKNFFGMTKNPTPLKKSFNFIYQYITKIFYHDE